MFEVLTQKLQSVFSHLAGQKKFTEDNIAAAMQEVKIALLEADVNYDVVSTLLNRVKEKAIGDRVLKSVKPGQQFTKVVHEELVSLMGEDEAELNLKGSPTVIMMCGLQGSGKTTQSAKLALFLRKKNKKILLAACDLQRPAAVQQLQKLGKDIDVPVFAIDGEKRPTVVAKKALEKTKEEEFDILIVDTAGRLHLDDRLMRELEEIREIVNPQEVLFVANAATGQDAVKSATEFNNRISITGSILSMLDGNARAGAAISIREVTGKPLKFEGIGEKTTDLQVFNPKSMADRILGMGDIINLVRKAEDVIDEKEAQKMQKKLRKATFNYEDYLKHIGMVGKMGSFKSIMGMMPGFSGGAAPNISGKELKQVEAMIYSMTPKERQEKAELSWNRRKRIAKGCAMKLDDINRMIKGFKRLKKVFKNMSQMKGKLKGLMPNMEDVKWR